MKNILLALAAVAMTCWIGGNAAAAETDSTPKMTDAASVTYVVPVRGGSHHYRGHPGRYSLYRDYGGHGYYGHQSYGPRRYYSYRYNYGPRYGVRPYYRHQHGAYYYGPRRHFRYGYR